MAYVYRHIRLDKNEPFYIGIGSDKYYKRANSKDRNAFWKRIAAKTKLKVSIAEDPLRAVVRGTGTALKNIGKFKFLMTA